MPAQFVGIDVSKKHLEVAIYPGVGGGQDAFVVANTRGGTRGLAKKLGVLQPVLVVMEASGGYERIARLALDEVGIPVAVMNPQRTKAFAAARGRKEKTDKIDASLLARFAEMLRPDPTPPPDPDPRHCARWLLAGSSWLESGPWRRIVYSSPLPWNGARLRHTLPSSTGRLGSWIERFMVLFGIGRSGSTATSCYEVSKASVLCSRLWSLPNFLRLGGSPTRNSLLWSGSAPYARDSGSKAGKRKISGGRSQVRHVLYMATLAAIRSNPAIREFYARLSEKGKLPKVVIVACMHKLLRVVNAVLEQRLIWDPDWRTKLVTAVSNGRAA